MPGLPRSAVYVPGVNLSFIWSRGDAFQRVVPGNWRDNDVLALLDAGAGEQFERFATSKKGWVDNVDVYREINAWLRARAPDWLKRNGLVTPEYRAPVRGSPHANP
ncbi:hypothetical protein [Umezawaea beigongshangensis]|uniref:hypothetical protein n=1 Tax=Umezawaea beigongshangensis TaxID=2780383 RepID=UPI0018F20D62|nr:hypothetical protein [Umezawaea beigongshangensis]